ncbi:hypothetical protein EYC80_010077 [Monilinia laxa]|uniref:Uncharacterized protein n=1 Tax=Monilinia laxa TaxID=61186 RepID=A0A5N6JTD2_MONLA|nr:hypothetical protein EYC80_010077 [Monilinia laxa]
MGRENMGRGRFRRNALQKIRIELEDIYSHHEATQTESEDLLCKSVYWNIIIHTLVQIIENHNPTVTYRILTHHAIMYIMTLLTGLVLMTNSNFNSKSMLYPHSNGINAKQVI